MKRFFAILLAVLALLVSCGEAQPAQYESTEKSEIVYKTADGQQLGLDVLYPTKRVRGRNPTVIVIHGGGWVSGSREDFYRDFEPLCDMLRAGGVTVIGVSYRLAVDGNTWRDCLEDCEDALSYLLDNAGEYDIDTENVGIIGYSAGAQLALLTAIETGDQIKYCVSMSAPTTFTTQRSNRYYSDTLAYYIGQAFGDELDLQKASPVVRVSRKCATRFLLVNGTADTVVSTAHAELFCREVNSFALESELLEPEGLTHSYPLYSGFRELCGEISEKVIAYLSDSD